MLKTFPLLSAVEAGNVRERTLAKIALQEGRLTYDLIHAHLEVIREFLVKKEEGRRTGKGVKDLYNAKFNTKR